jgi:DNA-binding GntR family transcriptional regulator
MPLPQSASKLSRTLAREEAYRRLREWIIDGTLKPVERLRDGEIAAALGVSRTPVREALLRLSEEGLVETDPNRWMRVTPLHIDNVAEIYAIIETLEVLGLQMAFPKLTRADLRRMFDANGAMKAAIATRDPADAVAADDCFHEGWVNRDMHPELNHLLGQVKTKVRRVELAYFDASCRGLQSFREHSAIISALERRSLPQARAALVRHWRAGLKRIRAQL